MTVLGVVFRPQLPPERLRAVARAADDAGLEELWLWEDCFLEGGISAAAAALAGPNGSGAAWACCPSRCATSPSPRWRPRRCTGCSRGA